METYRKIIIRLMGPQQRYTLDQIVSLVAQEVKPKIPDRTSLQAEFSKMNRLGILLKFKKGNVISFQLAEKYAKQNPFDMNRQAPMSDKDEAVQAYSAALKKEPEQPAEEPSPEPVEQKSPAKPTRKEREKEMEARRRHVPDCLNIVDANFCSICGKRLEWRKP